MKTFFFFFSIILINKTICFGNIISNNEVIGNKVLAISLDEQDRMILRQKSPATLEKIDELKPLSVNDVIHLSQSGVSDDIIITYMKETNSRYSLNQAQIYKMQNFGVSQRVINYMIDTGF